MMDELECRQMSKRHFSDCLKNGRLVGEGRGGGGVAARSDIGSVLLRHGGGACQQNLAACAAHVLLGR